MKTLSLFFIFSLSLYISAQVFCMDSLIFFDNLTTIDVNNKIKLKTFIEHASSTDPQEGIRKIQNELGRLHNKIIKRRKEALLNIKKKYVKSDLIWNDYKNIAQQINAFEESHKHMAISSCVHDDNVPTPINVMLRKNFEKHGINPKRFNVSLNENNIFTASPSMSFNVKSAIINSLEVTNPGTISIPLVLLKLSITEQEGFCVSAINSISSVLWTYCFMLFSLVNINKNPFKITETDQKKFLILAQHTSDLICALKNKNDCKTLKAYYKVCGSCYSSLWLESYKIFSKINRLHKALEWLKKYTI